MPNHPIFAPTFHGRVATVKKMLDADPSLVGVRDAKNLTPLHVAASRGQEKVARLLLDYGAHVHGPTDEGEWTPLVFASYRGHLDAVKVLIEYGAGVTEADGNPIHYAGQRKHKDICRILVECGAVDDLVDADDSSQIDLFRAAYSYDADAVEQILSAQPALVDSKDKYGRTALHEACTHGDTKTVRALLRRGADPSVRDCNGQTPADRALAHRQHGVAKLLAKHQRSHD